MLNCLKKFSMDCFRLDGKVAIVTDGNSRLGKAYAVALARAGANLIIQTYDTNWDETRKLIEKEGGEVIFVKTDLTKKEDRKIIIKMATEVYGEIDVLINNLETIKKPILLNNNENIELLVERNLRSAYFLTQEIAEIMVKQNSGKIINISSNSQFKEVTISSKNGDKHSLISFTKKFADELSAKNIQVNTIESENIKVKNITSNITDEGKLPQIVDIREEEKSIESFDIIRAIAFLSSKVSNYINGHIFSIDDGYLLK